MIEKKAQQPINHRFLAAMSSKTAIAIVNDFCASAAKAGTPIPKPMYEKIAFFRNRGTHYRKDDPDFAKLFSSIALFADASTEATRPTDSTALSNDRIARERKIYGRSSDQSSPQEALKQVEEKLAHAKTGKTRIKRDAEWLESAIKHTLETYKKGNKAAWGGIVTASRAVHQSPGAWPDY